MDSDLEEHVSVGYVDEDDTPAEHVRLECPDLRWEGTPITPPPVPTATERKMKLIDRYTRLWLKKENRKEQ